MKTILHIVTRPEDPLVRQIIEAQAREPSLQVCVWEFDAPDPDYHKLLEQIFAADSVEVW